MFKVRGDTSFGSVLRGYKNIEGSVFKNVFMLKVYFEIQNL